MARKPKTSPSTHAFIVLMGCVILHFQVAMFAPDTVFWSIVYVSLAVITMILAIAPFVVSRRWAVLILSCFYRNSVPVELIDHEGDRYYSLAGTDSDGRLAAPVHWSTNIGHCMLNDDGRVDPRSDSSYVYLWAPLRRKERVFHMLRNDFPDLAQLDELDVQECRVIMRNAYKNGD
jgi:hypothetical protein